MYLPVKFLSAGARDIRVSVRTVSVCACMPDCVHPLSAGAVPDCQCVESVFHPFSLTGFWPLALFIKASTHASGHELR